MTLSTLSPNFPARIPISARCKTGSAAGVVNESTRTGKLTGYRYSP